MELRHIRSFVLVAEAVSLKERLNQNHYLIDNERVTKNLAT